MRSELDRIATTLDRYGYLAPGGRRLPGPCERARKGRDCDTDCDTARNKAGGGPGDPGFLAGYGRMSLG